MMGRGSPISKKLHLQIVEQFQSNHQRKTGRDFEYLIIYSA